MIKTYNTLTKHKEELIPLHGKKINLFVCGPTVYDLSHIGHAKTYTQFDIIVKYLRSVGYEVFYLQNITDIDDKIIKRAKNRGIDAKKLTKEFEEEYYKDMKSLNITSVSEYARATDYIEEIIKQVKDLLDKGYAYEISDGIYFEVKKFEEYGKLSKNPLEQLKEGARVAVKTEKKHAYDFVLWKKSKPDEPSWDSPWGKGRPGWHIEDTAITESYFGPQYDVHGGAIDLIFPHHECEIAQMEAASGKKPLVKYWMHTAFLNINNEKMSKSLGNFLTIREALKKWDAKALRYFFAVNHYRTPIDFSSEHLDHAITAVSRINNFLEEVSFAQGKGSNGEAIRLGEEMFTSYSKTMQDDFNTPQAIASVFDYIREINKLDLSEEEALNVLRHMKNIDEVFGFMTFPSKEEVPQDIQEIANLREEARKNKDWSKSDEFRDKLNSLGWQVIDSSNGQRLKKKN